jgi:hypothetical protein
MNRETPFDIFKKTNLGCVYEPVKDLDGRTEEIIGGPGSTVTWGGHTFKTVGPIIATSPVPSDSILNGQRIIVE